MLAKRYSSLIGSEQSVLVEKDGMGRTECFAQAHFAHDAQPGSFARVRIAGATATHLIADAIP